jgi:hypothetical protein
MASEFQVYSDRRIKTNLVSTDADAYLEALCKLPVYNFNYIDEESKGTNARIGFMAQDVEAVLPPCVAPVSDYLPNVMRAAAVLSRPAPDVVSLDLSALPDDVLQLLRADGASAKVRAGGSTFFGAFDFGAQPSADASGCTAADFVASAPLPDGLATVFVVGTRVSDFRTLSYEQICAASIAAIQAQQRRIEALEQAQAFSAAAQP